MLLGYLKSSYFFQLTFEAVTVPFLIYGGDIAVDDVDIIPDTCGK